MSDSELPIPPNPDEQNAASGRASVSTRTILIVLGVLGACFSLACVALVIFGMLNMGY